MSLLSNCFPIFLVFVLIFSSLLNADEKVLRIGDDAPKLIVKRQDWKRGEPLTGFEKGKVHVLEFWGTWCGPCVASIPELIALQEAHKDQLNLVAVALNRVTDKDEPQATPEQHEDDLKQFLETGKGKDINYRVVHDPDYKIYDDWMEATFSSAVPTAFVINTDGKLVYIGRMPELKTAVEAVLRGEYDIRPAIAKYRQNVKESLELAVEVAERDRDYDKLLKAIEKSLSAEMPSPFVWEIQKFRILSLIKKQQKEATDWMWALSERDSYRNNFAIQGSLLSQLSTAAKPTTDRTVIRKIAERFESLFNQQANLNAAVQMRGNFILTDYYIDEKNPAKAQEYWDKCKILAEKAPDQEKQEYLEILRGKARRIEKLKTTALESK